MDTTTEYSMEKCNPGLIRLLQLVSPTLPTGSFSYSQGLEWAVEAGWVNDDTSLHAWLSDLLLRSIAVVDIPMLRLFYNACSERNLARVEECCRLLLACRESRELRAEEQQRGRAMAVLLQGLELVTDPQWIHVLSSSQLAGYAFASAKWEIDIHTAAVGYLWAWLENQVITGVKIIPLGQTAGQQLLLKLADRIESAVNHGLQVQEQDIGSSGTAIALASCFHETQYTRLYRS